MEELCNYIENIHIHSTIERRMFELIMNDMKRLAEYYYIWKEEKEDNMGFVIEPLPELDMYMDDNFIDQLYDFLLRNDFGRKVFIDQIRAFNPGEQIDFQIFENLFQNYLDVIIKL